ncbi:MatE-like protein [Fragilaria crotonensis]|nr:MatE-like protein [Fragilaria crotonensis]
MPPQEAIMDDAEAIQMPRESTSSDVERAAVTKQRAVLVWNEIHLLMSIAVPTVVIQLGSTIPAAMTASAIGRHLGSVHLDGVTLANLTGNLLTLALLWGLYSASDTLGPQAFGAGNYKEVGLIAIRGFVGSMLILIPINLILFFTMEDLLLMFGEAKEPSRLAAQWYRVYTFTLPFCALYLAIWKFLSSQEILMPVVLAMVISTGVVLPVALYVLVPTWGFMGSAIAILIFQVFEPLFLLAYLAWRKPFHPETWPGISHWREALAWEPFKMYMQLGFGGMMAGGEWAWWEFISLIIGTLGVVPLSAHTIPTQFLNVGYSIPLGIGTALAIRLGSLLPVNVPRAKQLVLWSVVSTVIVFAILSFLMYLLRASIFALFTTDPLVLAEVDKIWWKVIGYYFSLSAFGVVTGVAVGLGMQWTLGMVNLGMLWFVALPGLYVQAIRYGGGLDAAWSWIFPPYVAMNVILMYRFCVSNWDAISEEIREREGMDGKADDRVGPTEQTPLILL